MTPQPSRNFPTLKPWHSQGSSLPPSPAPAHAHPGPQPRHLPPVPCCPTSPCQPCPSLPVMPLALPVGIVAGAWDSPEPRTQRPRPERLTGHFTRPSARRPSDVTRHLALSIRKRKRPGSSQRSAQRPEWGPPRVGVPQRSLVSEQAKGGACAQRVSVRPSREGGSDRRPHVGEPRTDTTLRELSQTQKAKHQTIPLTWGP